MKRSSTLKEMFKRATRCNPSDKIDNFKAQDINNKLWGIGFGILEIIYQFQNDTNKKDIQVCEFLENIIQIYKKYSEKNATNLYDKHKKKQIVDFVHEVRDIYEQIIAEKIRYGEGKELIIEIYNKLLRDDFWNVYNCKPSEIESKVKKLYATKGKIHSHQGPLNLAAEQVGALLRISPKTIFNWIKGYKKDKLYIPDMISNIEVLKSLFEIIFFLSEEKAILFAEKIVYFDPVADRENEVITSPAPNLSEGND